MCPGQAPLPEHVSAVSAVSSPARNLPKEIHGKDTTTSAAPPWTDIRDSAIIRARSRVPVRETPPSRRGFPNWNSASFVFDVLRQHTTLRSASARVCSFGGGCAAQLWLCRFRATRAHGSWNLEPTVRVPFFDAAHSSSGSPRSWSVSGKAPCEAARSSPTRLTAPRSNALVALVAWLLGRSLR